MSALRLMAIVEEISTILVQKELFLATAESCTGGGVAQALTERPGSSEWFERGFVTYSNQSKQELLGVDALLLEQYGAVSRETAIAMARGVLNHSHAQVSLSITGIAGPTGGSVEKPVGLVWFAWAFGPDEVNASKQFFSGTRHQIREQAVSYALEGLLARMK